MHETENRSGIIKLPCAYYVYNFVFVSSAGVLPVSQYPYKDECVQDVVVFSVCAHTLVCQYCFFTRTHCQGI